MKKLIFIILISISVSNIVGSTNSFTANAGIIKWGVKKAIGTIIKIIFSSAKESIIEYNKKKLVAYLNKHPEYIDYAVGLIKKQINKHSSKYKDRGYKILQYLLNNTSSSGSHNV